jgi:hypothetical protein
MNKAFIESVKEGLRVFLMAVVPLLIVQLQNGSFEWKTIIIAGVIALLRFIDKWLHNSGVSELGLTRF